MYCLIWLILSIIHFHTWAFIFSVTFFLLLVSFQKVPMFGFQFPLVHCAPGWAGVCGYILLLHLVTFCFLFLILFCFLCWFLMIDSFVPSIEASLGFCSSGISSTCRWFFIATQKPTSSICKGCKFNLALHPNHLVLGCDGGHDPTQWLHYHTGEKNWI